MILLHVDSLADFIPPVKVQFFSSSWSEWLFVVLAVLSQIFLLKSVKTKELNHVKELVLNLDNCASV